MQRTVSFLGWLWLSFLAAISLVNGQASVYIIGAPISITYTPFSNVSSVNLTLWYLKGNETQAWQLGTFNNTGKIYTVPDLKRTTVQFQIPNMATGHFSVSAGANKTNTTGEYTLYQALTFDSSTKLAAASGKPYSAIVQIAQELMPQISELTWMAELVVVEGQNWTEKANATASAHQVTRSPTRAPTPPTTSMPTALPTSAPTTAKPTVPSVPTTLAPTLKPTPHPTRSPTTKPTPNPTLAPTKKPSKHPTMSPTKKPSKHPSKAPSKAPTPKPTPSPTRPTNNPTKAPTKKPSKHPTRSPTKKPSKHPTRSPTKKPTPSPVPTKNPTMPPTKKPSKHPTRSPTKKPSKHPTVSPTKKPTVSPTKKPTNPPTKKPTDRPTRVPTTAKPTPLPTPGPTTSVQSGFFRRMQSLNAIQLTPKQKVSVVGSNLFEVEMNISALTGSYDLNIGFSAKFKEQDGSTTDVTFYTILGAPNFATPLFLYNATNLSIWFEKKIFTTYEPVRIQVTDGGQDIPLVVGLTPVNGSMISVVGCSPPYKAPQYNTFGWLSNTAPELFGSGHYTTSLYWYPYNVDTANLGLYVLTGAMAFPSVTILDNSTSNSFIIHDSSKVVLTAGQETTLNITTAFDKNTTLVYNFVQKKGDDVIYTSSNSTFYYNSTRSSNSLSVSVPEKGLSTSLNVKTYIQFMAQDCSNKVVITNLIPFNVTEEESSSSSSSSKLNGGEIAGIVIGGVLLLLIIAYITWRYVKHKRNADESSGYNEIAETE